MIEIKDLTKSFKDKLVLDSINLTIPDNTIFGLVGINGAGKSTLMRMMMTIYKPDSGTILFDSLNPFINSRIKENIFFLADDPYYTSTTTTKGLAKLYMSLYKSFDYDRLNKYMEAFNLDINEKIINFSKGMKRKCFIAIALACNVKYIILDEAFDGLDPKARMEFKKMISKIMDENDNLTFIMSSHSLKDLEDIADTFAIIDNKKVLSSGNTYDCINEYVKYQIGFNKDFDRRKLEKLNPISLEINGRLSNVTFLRSELDLKDLEDLNPAFIEEVEIKLEDYFEFVVGAGDLNA